MPTAVFAAVSSPTDLAWLRNEVGDGALAYESGGTIYLTELSTGNTQSVGSGTKPEFSPDSSKLAWIDGTTAKGRMRRGSDTSIHVIAQNVTANAGLHWVSNSEVVLVRSGKWRRISLSGNEAEVPELTALGLGGRETDIKLGADGVWSYVNETTWKTSEGQSGNTGGSCSSSLSPDGRSVTGLLHEHKECLLTRIRSGGTSGKLTWVYDFSGSKGFDNHRWSSNDGRFVVCQDEKYNYMFVIKVGGTRGTRMGKPGSGDMYGDFTVGDGHGDSWPGLDPKPVLTHIEVAPAMTTVIASGKVQLTASTKDQQGQPIAASLSWTTSGGGVVTPAVTSGAAHQVVFVSNGTTGEFSVRAVSGAVNGHSRITVTAKPPVNQPPRVEAGAAQTTQVSLPVFLDGTVTDDGLPSGVLEVEWSVVSGPGSATLDDPSNPKTRVTFAAAGRYVLRLSADDGAAVAYGDVIIDVQNEPAIAITAPQPGQSLTGGQTFRIQWSTVSVADVQIEYSLDGGESWEDIVGSVDTKMDEWGNYPWTVPNRFSDACLIKITGYYGEVPTKSGVFSISPSIAPPGSDASLPDNDASSPEHDASTQTVTDPAADAGVAPPGAQGPLSAQSGSRPGLVGGCALTEQGTRLPVLPGLLLLVVFVIRRSGRGHPA